jgi:hypothetical protein
MTGMIARTSRNNSDAAVNSRLVRQTINRKGRRFLSAPTRSLSDLLAAEDPKAAGPGARPPLLYCRGIKGFL